ncbi:hypothetical protein FJZ31_12800 [Candidatus Poribacteria bacterium]|nr:hypothetical protein [Candidatus Poribacteria bacterium]
MVFLKVDFQKRILAGVILLLVSCLPLQASEQKTKEDSTMLQEKAIKVFLDIPEMDNEHIKREIPFVNYVRDRKQAQVHIMMTTQPTGSGGTEYCLFFIGQEEFTGKKATLMYFSKQDDTEEVIRSGIVKVLKAGLMPYVAQTPLLKDMDISYRKKAAPMDVIDKWDSWVFNINADSWFDGEESRSSYSLYGSISADRVTPEWKISTAISTDYNREKFEFEQKSSTKGESEGKENSLKYEFEDVRTSHHFHGMIVKSINEHWSVGGYISADSSIYSNTRLGINVAPALEFNVFPYSESTRREFRFLYRLDYRNIQYEEETIYDKLKEQLLNESLAATVEIKEKWGSISTTLSGSHYFHDFSKNYLNLSSNLNIRLLEGFSIDLFGSVSRIHDQLGLQKGDLSQEDILLRRRQLSTQYNYYGSIGLRYTFGSIFSNVVNPRFGGGAKKLRIRKF